MGNQMHRGGSVARIGRSISRGIVGLAGIAVLATMAGCGTLPNLGMQAKTPEQQVAARSAARSKALMKHDYHVVYGFMTPGYRKTFGFSQYADAHTAHIDLKKVKVVKVTCADADSCKVLSQWTYVANVGPKGVNVGEVTSVIPEKWIKVDGQWWYYEGHN